ncbi:hypothetical protein ACTFIV_008278 [Dictyostelium citrinum]
MDIDMINENQNYYEIIKIAKSYNINAKGKKSEIIKRINKYIKEKKENKLQTKKIQFKSNIDELAIKDIEIREILFWRIIKNKVLFNNIFSNFHHSFLNSYHCINDISWMTRNNHIELLKDKVYKNYLYIDYNEYLTESVTTINRTSNICNRNFNIPPSLHWYEHIFIAIKYDVKFYQFLFLKYNKYFLNNYYHVVLSAIQHGCLIALKIILEEGYYQFEEIPPTTPPSTPSSSSSSSSSSSIPINKTNPTSKINNPSVTKIQLLSNAIRNACIYSRLKIYKYLTEDYMVNIIYLSKKEKKEISKLLIESKFFRSISSSGKKNSMKFLNYLFDTNGKYKSIINGKPIKTMLLNEIQCCLFSATKSVLKIFSLSNLIESVKLLELFSFKSFDCPKIEFTNEQLKLKLLPILINQQETTTSSSSSSSFSSEPIKGIVIHLIDKLFSFINFPLYDKIILNKAASQYFGLTISHLKMALKFGNHSILKQFKINGTHSSIDIWFDMKPNRVLLFKFCQNNREKQIEFIKEIIHPISQYGQSFNPRFVLYLLIGNDDVSLLELSVKEYGGISEASLLFKKTHILGASEIYGDSGDGKIYDFKNSIFLCFKSISMLEYCFKNFPWIFELEKNAVESWYSLGRIDLLKRFEQLVGIENYDRFFLPLTKSLSFNSYPTLFKQFYEYNITKTAIYVISKSNAYSKFDETILQHSKPIFNQQHFENIKYLIENTKSTIKSYQPFESYNGPIQFINTWDINLLDWLFSFNDGDEIKSERCILDYNGFFSGLILTNRLNDENWINYSSSKFSQKDIFDIVIPLLKNTKSSIIIDQIFNYYFLPNINTIINNNNNNNNINKKQEYLDNFKKICLVLDLKSFKHIYFNYRKFLIIKKHKSNNDCGNDTDGLFTLKELQFLLSYGEKNYLFNLVEFFNSIGIIKI